MKSMPRAKMLILVISRDLGLADIRYRVLVGGGFDVMAATDIRGVIAGARAQPDVAMIGYSVPDPEKRRVCAELLRHKVPILELYRSRPVLPDATHHLAHDAEDFLPALKELLKGGKEKARGRGATPRS
jgi:DNA-binding response OmpR family regulator